MDADTILTNKQSAFYFACRETFQKLLYPSRSGLTDIELEPQYVAGEYDGEKLVIDKLKDAYKYREETAADSPFKGLVESQLWPAGVKEVRWADLKRRAASEPSWVFHHPRALDSLKAELVLRDQWRANGDFIERGPFDRPEPVVEIQQMSRDGDTGEVRLRVKPLNADGIAMSESGPPTDLSQRLEDYEVNTKAPRLWFRAVDTTDETRIGRVEEWATTVTLKHRPPYIKDGNRTVELSAYPGGAIRFTMDGSSPETSGSLYEGPIVVSDDERIILAVADYDGVLSAVTRFDLPSDGHGGVVIEANKPATWRHRHQLQSTHETFEWLEQAAKHGVRLAGVELNTQRDQRYISVNTDQGSPYGATTVRAWADEFKGLFEEGETTLTVEVCHFDQGADLTAFVAALKLSAEPGEVQQ